MISMKALQGIHSRGRTFFLITLALLICASGAPALLAQAAKELVAEACYNARHQLEQKPLSSSRIERRTGGHVYLEEEIETVDGSVRRLISVDGHEPTAPERKQDDDKLRDLVQNPKTRQAFKKANEADEKRISDLLQAIPEAFLFEDEGIQGGLEKVAFRPNPVYKPNTYEERAIHALGGFIMVNLEEKRLAQLSATLMQQVDFGFGVIGHLDKGGTINLTRIPLAPGIWKTSSSKTTLTGRLVLFKTINKQQDETHSDFKLIAPNTSISQAVQQLAGNVLSLR
jgi:hypothetical protein